MMQSEYSAINADDVTEQKAAMDCRDSKNLFGANETFLCCLLRCS
jgi:hypothetical protein